MSYAQRRQAARWFARRCARILAVYGVPEVSAPAAAPITASAPPPIAAPRRAKLAIDLRTIPSSMEQLAAGWKASQ